jgi:hypothetical protein
MIESVQALKQHAQAPRRADDPQPPQDAQFMHNPQDEIVMSPAPAPVKNVSAGPVTDRAELVGTLEPNEDGAYVYPENDPRSAAAQSFAAVARTIQMFEAAIGQPVNWAFGSERLSVTPDDGDNLNAYYSRWGGGVVFFHSTDPITGDNVMSGKSGEVSAHEAGHALLDAYRPGYFDGWSPDVAAFHESFGDMMSIISGLNDDRVVARVAVQTGGDLRRQNVAAHLGEQLGRGINNSRGNNATGGDWVRNAINNFTWADPSTLPDRGGPDQLGRQAHSFSRLWTGAFYQVLTEICNEKVAAGVPAQQALKETGAEGLSLLANLMKNAPQGDFTYREMGNAFVASDREHNGGQRADLIQRVLTDRLILEAAPPPEPPPSEPPTEEPPAPPTSSSIFTTTAEGRKPLDEVTRKMKVRLSGPEFGLFNGASVETRVDRGGSLGKDAQVSQRTRENVAALIKEGRIKYADPNVALKYPGDYFDAEGRPYVGVVRWEGGEMKIERVKIAS